MIIGDLGSLVFNDLMPWSEKLQLYKNNTVSSIKLEPKEPLKEECLHFLKACQNRIKPRTHGDEVALILKILSDRSFNKEKNPACR